MCFARQSPVVLMLVLVCATPKVEAAASDPPARIGRVSYMTGSVSFRPGGVDDWVSASLSYPLTTGAELWSDKEARAEVHIGGSAVRLGSKTLVELLSESDHDTQIRIAQGVISVRVRRLPGTDTYEIDTPTGTVSLLRDGSYRIDVTPDGQRSTITVRQGRAEVSTRGGTVRMGSGESLAIADPNSPPPAATVAVAIDDWERWSESRDLQEDQSLSLRYLSPDFVGFEALDNYGTWQINADFGPVWVPEAPAGWAPYRFGSWEWVAPWGWTWIDDAPWGFAPSHYGRWTFLQAGWAWVPGQILDLPVYAPALVAFLGGSGFDLSLSLGEEEAVAWFPLAPGEVYIPGYRASQTYIRELNVPSVKITELDLTTINMAKIQYRNRSLPGAVTVVSRDAFLRGEPVSKAAVRVSASALGKATVIGTSAQVPHGKQNVLPRTLVRSAARPPTAALNRQVVMRHTPPPAPPASASRPARPAAGPAMSGRNNSARSTGQSTEQQHQPQRSQILARQAAERAELERRQQSELINLPSPDLTGQVQQRHARAQAELAQRHSAELQRFDRRRN